MNKILTFNCINSNCSVAISEGKRILSFLRQDAQSKQAESIIPMIEESLRLAGIGYKDLDGLATINGPGSFTGIRIGLAVAKGISLGAKNLKPMTFTNFELGFYRAIEQVKNYSKFYILIDAYRNQQYMQEFCIIADVNKDGLLGNSASSQDHIILNNLFKVTDPVLLDNDQAIQIINNQKDPIAISGSGIIHLYDKIKDNLQVKILPRFPEINARHICYYADVKMNLSDTGFNPPLYIRPPDAKISTRPF